MTVSHGGHQSDSCTELPRGGYVVETSRGYVQFGSPPETVKDTMLMPLGASRIFVLPHDHFGPRSGASLAEIEFPTYYNYFFKKRKVTALVEPGKAGSLRRVFREAFLGPRRIRVAEEHAPDGAHCPPDMRAEMEYFRNGMEVEDVLEIREIEPAGSRVDGVRIIPEAGGGYTVTEGGRQGGRFPASCRARPFFSLGATLEESFEPPEFGITCLGPSHGFDPTQNTSGFLLWLNRNGIMIDPPVNTTEWLHRSNVNPKLIDTVILTHCHADHDAGTFQKILEETRISIYTTPTIMQSFLTKYSSLTGIPATTLMQMFDFHPVKVNVQYNLHGALFSFYCSIHSIPTIGFYFLYRDKSFLYSSDHMADPQVLRGLHERGILPAAVQKRITVSHISAADFPRRTKLHLATFGIGDTLYPRVQRHRFEAAYQILDVFSRIDIFRELPFEKIKYLLLHARKVTFRAGDMIIHRDTPGDTFYVIVSGTVSIAGEKTAQTKSYGTYEYFGEVSLVLDVPRSADVLAVSDVTAYTLDKVSFLRLIENTEVLAHIKRVADARRSDAWEVLKTNRHFRALSNSQLTALESLLEPESLASGTRLPAPGEHPRYYYILASGSARRVQGDGQGSVCVRGELLGDPLAHRERRTARFSYELLCDPRLYRIRRADFERFLTDNPRLLMDLIFEAPGP